jgi:signal peptidase I
MAGNDELGVGLLDAAVELMGRSSGRGTFQVRGESMTPTLTPGSLVAVDFSQTSLRRGDILLFRQADYLTVHRLLGTARFPDGSPCLRTRGDGRNRLDPPLDRSRVHGRVFAVLRDEVWREMRSGRARLYATALAFHDLVWAAAGVLAARIDRRVGREGSPGSLERAAGAVDRMLLGLFHRVLFPWFHPRIAAPEGLEEAPGQGGRSP